MSGQYLTEANQTSSFASSLFKQNQIAQPCINKERLKHLKDHLYSFTCAQTANDTKFNNIILAGLKSA